MGDRGKLRLDRSAFALLIVAAAFSLGAELVGVVLGAWLEDRFALLLAGIAGLVALVGGAELTGALSTAAFTDRLGKRRAVAIGLVVSAAGYVGLAVAEDSLVVGIGAALVAFAGFEFTIISSFPLASEAVAGGRARYLAWMVVAFGIGRTVAGYAGTRIYASLGFEWNAILSVVANCLATVLLLLLVREPGGSVETREGAAM